MITVSDVLLMPVVRSADPQTLAGHDGLSRSVRWVHTTELPDIAGLLREGDLVLTTGIALADTAEGLAAFAHSLAESGAAGLFLELGRRWQEAPPALVETCEIEGLPLVVLRREARFASVAQSVGERIVDQQLTELRESQQVHDTFTALSVAEAGPKEILEAVSNLAAATAVLESEEHRVLDYVVGPGDATAFLDDWHRRSLAAQPRGRTAWDSSHGWLIARIGRSERRWGRLVLDSPTPPSQRLVAVAERGAAALAMHMLHDRQRTSRERQVHHELLVALLADPTSPEVEQRCRLAGVPTANRRFIAVAFRPTEGELRRSSAAADELVAALVHATATRPIPVLIAPVGGLVRALLSVPRRMSAAKVADDIAGALPSRLGFLAAAGSEVHDLSTVDRSMREARQVLAALRDDAAPGKVHHLVDVHVRGLLTLVGDDERLHAFSDRELGPLRSGAEHHDTRLEQALRAVLQHPASKSAAAASIAVSRPVLYERIAQIERRLGVDLDDGETRTSLHLALIIDEIRRSTVLGDGA
ncbi:PucR family transcriptional regulator [Nocardioides sp. AN3]